MDKHLRVSISSSVRWELVKPVSHRTAIAGDHAKALSASFHADGGVLVCNPGRSALWCLLPSAGYSRWQEMVSEDRLLPCQLPQISLYTQSATLSRCRNGQEIHVDTLRGEWVSQGSDALGVGPHTCKDIGSYIWGRRVAPTSEVHVLQEFTFAPQNFSSVNNADSCSF